MATDPAMLQDWYKSYMAKQPATAAAATTNAASTAWNPDTKSTVQGQVANITDGGGPLMQRAETKALQGANSRGLLNSSIAVSAGQSALYDAALPMAQQDANTFASAGRRNADAADTVSLANAGAANSNAQFNANSNNRATSEQAAAGVAGAQQQAGFQQQTAIQTSDNAAAATRQAADIGSRYDLAKMDVSSRASLQQADAANQQLLQKAQATLQTNLSTQAQGVQQSMQQYDLAVKQAMHGTDNQTRLQIATLDANTQAALAETNNKYRVQLQSSQSMTASYQSMVDGISRVMVDPNMDAIAKQTAIGNLTTLYNNTLGMQSTLTGLNLGQLLSDGAPVVGVPSTPAWNQPVGNAPAPAPATEPGPNRDW